MARKPSEEDLVELRNSLTSARALLRGDMSQLEEAALSNNGAPDSTEADESAHHVAFNLELLERDGSTLREVDEALERMDQGTYGRCESCQVWIPKTRLEYIPWARFCIQHQEEAEKNRESA